MILTSKNFKTQLTVEHNGTQIPLFDTRPDSELFVSPDGDLVTLDGNNLGEDMVEKAKTRHDAGREGAPYSVDEDDTVIEAD